MSDCGTPKRARDRLQTREIEQKLTADLHAAREQVRTATREEERAKAQEAFNRTLEQFKNFIARGEVP